MEESTTCPQCKGSGNAYKYRGGDKYWYPCPICNGGKKQPDLKRYKEWLKEDNIKPKPKKEKK